MLSNGVSMGIRFTPPYTHYWRVLHMIHMDHSHCHTIYTNRLPNLFCSVVTLGWKEISPTERKPHLISPSLDLQSWEWCFFLLPLILWAFTENALKFPATTEENGAGVWSCKGPLLVQIHSCRFWFTFCYHFFLLPPKLDTKERKGKTLSYGPLLALAERKNAKMTPITASDTACLNPV